MNLKFFQPHIFTILSQEILKFVIAILEESHSGSKLTEKLFLVELHPQLRVAHHQIIIIIHERPILLSIP